MSAAAGGGQRRKILLMGRSGGGKTSMRSIIFANYMAKETSRLQPTLQVEHSHIRLLGDLVVGLLDCGGQDAFYETYFSSQREFIFRGVSALIYVIDVASADPQRDLAYFQSTAAALAEYSPDARCVALVHKMDLVPEGERERVFAERDMLLRALLPPRLPFIAFGTSIYDETLYQAWSTVVRGFLPNLGALERRLDDLAEACGAEEVVLFEKATFLMVAQSALAGSGARAHARGDAGPDGAVPPPSSLSLEASPLVDPHRFEKISNIVKQFKLSCAKFGGFAGLRLAQPGLQLLLEAFTPTTYVLVVQRQQAQIPQPRLDAAAKPAAAAGAAQPQPQLLMGEDAVLLRVAAARPVFERLIAQVV